ncbi:DUF6343 family protein [Streptomyces sp. V3I7]|uniref:DUF6343 family protein n=1 Tax=Streptomyces sp. V3I7 TaxID=3042278 RepID=UPI0027895791|nr:DUF6343 family protein [Streptomyces sp. V3I7]MDQ0994636.1 hypothetical protein [Streptomyces sp. V3I7]
MRRRRSPDDAAGVPRSRSGVVGHRRERTGAEPVTARSALELRLVLGVAGLLLLLLGTALFALWASVSGAQDSPTPGELGTLAALCGALALLTVVDLVIVIRRRARERGGRPHRH